MEQMLRHVTYFAEWHFLKKSMFNCVLLKSVYDLEKTYIFPDRMGAFYL